MNLIAKILPGAAAYPDIHPMLVHFPAALFPVAFFFALLSVWKYPGLVRTSRALIWLFTRTFSSILAMTNLLGRAPRP